MSSPRILIYLLRRDLRVADNPVLTEISRLFQQPQRPFTHLLPLYVFPAQQVEVSGFLSSESEKSPYPEARSQVGGFWRCGHHRARWLAESVWDVKKGFESLGSGLVLRVGMVGDVVQQVLRGFEANDGEVVGLWMTEEEGVEEKREEKAVRKAVEAQGGKFRLWMDEKYFIDDRDLPFQNSRDFPDVFTSFRKRVEPLRNAPRRTLAKLSALPPLPQSIPPQSAPFTIPKSLEDTISALLKPLDPNLGLKNPPKYPSDVKSAHPFHGGETTGHDRIKHLITSGAATAYKDTRNGLLGEDFSTKFSAWLALGSITARQVHSYLIDFEDAKTDLGEDAHGYGKGENKGTAAIRFELLWRDYMRLCTRKFGPRLFRIEGFRNDKSVGWKYLDRDPAVQDAVRRFCEGRTGTGLIDASQRELFFTGYTSNRVRQNVASFLAKHLGIDWRIGAEWYESLLVDYDLSNNWGNWQYVAGVGNDPRGEARVFNPVKQAFDYDPKGEYVKAWCEELRGLENLTEVFQPWKLPVDGMRRLGLGGEGVDKPLKRIEFRSGRGRAGDRGSRGGGGGQAQGRASSSGRGNRGGEGGHWRGRGGRGRGHARLGKQDKAQVAQYGGEDE